MMVMTVIMMAMMGTVVAVIDAEMLGFGASGQERIFETFLVRKDGVVKAQGQYRWAERAAMEPRRLADYILPSWEGFRDSTNLPGILEKVSGA